MGQGNTKRADGVVESVGRVSRHTDLEHFSRLPVVLHRALASWSSQATNGSDDRSEPDASKPSSSDGNKVAAMSESDEKAHTTILTTWAGLPTTKRDGAPTTGATHNSRPRSKPLPTSRKL